MSVARTAFPAYSRLTMESPAQPAIVQANPYYGKDVPMKRIVIRHINDPGAQYLPCKKATSISHATSTPTN
ncbi:hypothetical protein [Rhizobium leguminosarum]|uniref:hypothetical protein n=1 Tax=Rhizobium leguminosarum TaxID=384 RepID=UPI001C9267C6|nr:hypothetical protein [Rhizobium leguminosarum]MBY2919717.1 hypothetical protein [Rhizobium leguminosarum]MBY2975411.1 hypothetical protein [Rhizobium leguminosarum]MBY2977653.1 hypothetical protein [Rhizobium leguminosarum]MBY3006203.1 hypothetical protein [Rhizobium leguminosarum]